MTQRGDWYVHFLLLESVVGKMDHILSHKLVSSDAPIDILNMVQKSSENRA
jgi:hypothetical protein